MNLILTVALEIPLETRALASELLDEHVALELRQRLMTLAISVLEDGDEIHAIPIMHCRLLGIRKAAVPEPE